ncbi:MAG: hypothetical protein WCF84_07165 [Anaerolineae bacterium]
MQSNTRTQFATTTPALRILLYAASVLVFLVGIPLYLFSTQTDIYFAYTVTPPLGAAFIGAAYWAASLLEFFSARERLWANARGAVPAVLAFTTLVFISSLLSLSFFHWTGKLWITWVGTYVWLAVYLITPIALAVLFWHQLRQPGGTPARLLPLPLLIRVGIAVHAAVLLVVGILFLFAPQTVDFLWPWSMFAWSARIIGSWIFGFGLAAVAVVWENDLARVRPIIYSAIAFSLLQFIALARDGSQAHWERLAVWFYLLFLVEFLIGGLLGWAALRRLKAQQLAIPAQSLE